MSHQVQEFGTFSDSAVESFMKDLGVLWEEQSVPVACVDLADNTFQTRLNTAQCSVVAKEYAEKMKAGDSFPMMVLQRKGTGRFRVVCGRHRATAYDIAQNGKASSRCYVVSDDTPMDVLLALSARDNNANGVRQGTAETARVAADVVAKMPIAAGARCHRNDLIRRVANRFGANQSTVSDHYFAKLTAAEMIRVGCSTEGVPMSAMRSLWKWTDHASWREIARAVSENASATNLAKVISAANKDKADALTLITRIKEAACPGKDGFETVRVRKDPAFVMLEHLGFALRDFRDLAPPRNLPEEVAEDIASAVEAIRLECKEWKKR